MIPGIAEMFLRGTELGVENVVLGMPHRGRLNVLANLMQKPLRQLFNDFHPHWTKEDSEQGSGDVKYHLGASTVRTMSNGKKLNLSLASNPSHLEAVDPVVVGKVRAKQSFLGDKTRAKVMGILVHGDAAFAGQGVIAETLSLSALKDYETGGTIHFIVNNQIGFTTDPENARSCPYPSDVAKMVGAPIFHVNGDDPIAVHNVCKLATEWRQEFKRDVVVDMFCYRKYGHNELDEPMFTQPKMYTVIRARPSTAVLWEKKLLSEHKITEEECKEIKANIMKMFETEFEASKTTEHKKKDWLEDQWNVFKQTKTVPTGVSKSTLQQIGKKMTTVPEGFTLHRGVAKIYQDRQDSIASGSNLDWGTMETLAYASLVKEGYPVRLSGQDCERGTFSHRHATVHDQKTFVEYCPLQSIDPEQAFFNVSNSSLSEFGVLGFELGFSIEHPNILVLWEAQFGDFANGAQTIFDQFISCGERKWYRQSGITVLLPHGYDGNGPEHSSARPERFLQMIDEHPYKIQTDIERAEAKVNMQIVNCTTPANFFHVLRRQVLRGYRKPLIIMTPKKLLKHRMCRSTMKDVEEGTSFLRVIPEHENFDTVTKVILCTGQVYYDIIEARNEKKVTNMAVIRVEQLAPFPWAQIQKEIEKYGKMAQVFWAQEEHMNMGAWHYMEPRLGTLLEKDGRRVKYLGRDPEAAPATGILDAHEQQKASLMNEIFA
jgi:2-oxoglutarate dehydrogenase E1 component